MPIRKDKNGKWWWGHHGPYDTRAKAAAVAGAAYANGYKSKKKKR